MSFDANAVVCADINKASFSLASADEIRKIAVCTIYSTVAFDGDQPRRGGVHDSRMGPIDDSRKGDPCGTCGGKEDCPGHLGCIELYLPVYHPLFIADLIRLLKASCLLCRRLKLSAGQATVFLKKFQMVQLGELGLLAKFEQANAGASESRGGSDGISSEKRIELKKILKELREKEISMREADPRALTDLRKDISFSATSIETWRKIRGELLDLSASSHCTHCGRKFSRTIRKKALDLSIEVAWDYESECPVDRSILLKTIDRDFEIDLTGDKTLGTVRDSSGLAGVDDETVRRDHRSLGRRGKAVGMADLQAYQVAPILRDIFNSPDAPLIIFMFPEAAYHGFKFFFMEVVPVSSNKFRPKAKSAGFGGGGKKDDAGGILHPRTTALIDILNENAKVGFALNTLRYPDPVKQMEDKEGGLQDQCPPTIVWRDKDKLNKAVDDHRGNYALLHQYCRGLQEKVNCYIDSTKTTARNPPPAIRQWLEKKQGAIRQKMMGKRVNYAARTTIAPDAMINTNEIGIPIPFAMKLSINEHAVPHNVELLCRLIMNGPKVYPGCNTIIEPSGRKLDLIRRPLSEQQKRFQCKLLRNHVERQIAGGGIHNRSIFRPYIVSRHLRDGDVVVMNRQPSLHRASMMAHFIRVLTGQKTFRLNYANCGSYNADFDGDEMNMHCPQDHTARAEAAFVINSDCNYNVVKSGEPLRGLIQDHVLGGNFLTVRGTFLTKDQYCNLIYVGVAAFVDKGERFNLKSSQLVFPEFAAGDPYARALGARNIQVVTDPPTIWKPEPLWTGKQVITAVMKTLIDAIALHQFGKNADGTPNADFLLNYRGINLTSKAKTQGDAWNGKLDKDMEEQKVVIRHSELLQGVFDKAQFGASSYGLVHLCYELMGPRVAGALLSVFQRINTNYLQQRGFSCSAGDFQMTSEGEATRADLIMRITAAGSYLQESFVDAVYQQMHWKEKITNTHGVRSKYVHVHKSMAQLLASKRGEYGKLASGYVRRQVDTFKKSRQADMEATYFSLPNKNMRNMLMDPKQVPTNWPADPYKSTDLQETNRWLTDDQRQLFIQKGIWETSSQLIKKAKQEPMGDAPPAQMIGDKQVLNVRECDTKNSWNLTRSLHTPFPTADWRLQNPNKVLSIMAGEIEKLKKLGLDNARLREEILVMLTKRPEVALYFPNAAKLLGVSNIWGPAIEPSTRGLVSSAGRTLGLEPPPAPVGRLAPPLPNVAHVLPSGGVVRGDGSLRVPRMFHPSWAWRGGENDLPFESPLRYVSRLLQVDAWRISSDAANADRLYLMMPSEMTRMRMTRLIEDYFAGRQDVFLTMFDKFFQANMGKLSSKNNDLVSGDVTLYPFPRNGFSSMVTTGAKGSKVNFAMICGMLSQQSLEGKRVPLMISGKSHPSFGTWDLGARAGGLITDRFLTGLRPPDYFFHCMAGREGLVDTAVKTARSGYLQRCVIKSLEGMTVAYDGSVRESDGSVIQFLYGEDGADVCKMTYLSNLSDLMANPVMLQAKYGSKYKLQNPQLASKIQKVEEIEIGRLNEEAKAEDRPAWQLAPDPITRWYAPTTTPGCVSENYEASARKQAMAALSKNLILHDSEKIGLVKRKHIAKNQLWSKKDGSMTTLGRLLRLKFTGSLAEPGDAVGCLAAQSMGEPATQMTLNTFHLAGHGAANVTLGIPRLREILQTAGNAATPVLYIPVKGDTKIDINENAGKVMLGFRKILLSDVINSVGVEANVYWQPSGKLPDASGNAEYIRGLYDNDCRYGDGRAKKFWSYETTIQFENLDHFCKVVPKYTPQKIVNFTINRVVKEMLKLANKMMAISATKTADEIWDSEDDELGFAAERYVYERNMKTIFDKKRAIREMIKSAGLGFGAAQAAAENDGGDLDMLTSADAGMIYRKGNKKDEEGGENREDDDAGPEEDDDGALPDSDVSKDDSEEDLSDPEGIDTELKVDEDVDLVEAEEEAKEKNSDDETEDEVAHIKKLQKKKKMEAAHFPTLEKWKYDVKRRCLRRDKALEKGLSPDHLEEEALWSDGEGAGFRSKTLPDEAFRYLTDLKVCNKTWRIVVKFGWPVERCPRRIEFLPLFTRIIQKHVLQATPGVANPHIVGKADATTCKKRGSKEKVECEIQCEGSNLEWVALLSDRYVDHTKISTNDIKSMFSYYGVECGRACVIQELAAVFAVYGIDVNFRHLSLIADAMTHSGHFRAFSRMGMQHNPSPLLQMSFETSIKFLTEGVERGAIDNLRTPAGAIVVGRNTAVGTGMCRPLTSLQVKKRKPSNKPV